MIIMIAAIGKNLELGKGNDLIWHLPDDMKFFRSTTSGNTIVMGRKTFESLGGLLPKRHHIVLTSNPDYTYEGVEVVNDLSPVVEAYAGKSDKDCYIIGGGQIYSKFLPCADRMFLTYVDDECPDAEVYFPNFNELDYDVTVVQEIENDGSKATIKQLDKRYE